MKQNDNILITAHELYLLGSTLRLKTLRLCMQQALQLLCTSLCSRLEIPERIDLINLDESWKLHEMSHVESFRSCVDHTQYQEYKTLHSMEP